MSRRLVWVQCRVDRQATNISQVAPSPHVCTVPCLPWRVQAPHSSRRKALSLSYRLIGRNVGLSKNTVMEIVRRDALG